MKRCLNQERYRSVSSFGGMWISTPQNGTVIFSIHVCFLCRTNMSSNNVLWINFWYEMSFLPPCVCVGDTGKNSRLISLMAEAWGTVVSTPPASCPNLHRGLSTLSKRQVYRFVYHLKNKKNPENRTSDRMMHHVCLNNLSTDSSRSFTLTFWHEIWDIRVRNTSTKSALCVIQGEDAHVMFTVTDSCDRLQIGNSNLSGVSQRRKSPSKHSKRCCSVDQ